MTNSSVRDYETPMDWYLGRKPRDSIDNRIEVLERMKSYFPSKHYREAQAEKRQIKTFGSYFPTKEYLAIRETSNKERAERRKARNESISAVYNQAVVPAVKGVYNYGVVPITKLMKESVKWAANRGYKLANNLMELYSLKQKYGDLDEELAKAREKLDNILSDNLREDIIDESFEEVKPEKTTSDYEEPTSPTSPKDKTDRKAESPLENTVEDSLYDEVMGTGNYKPLSESEIEKLIRRTRNQPQTGELNDTKYEEVPFSYIAEPVESKDNLEREIPKYEFPDSKYEEIKKPKTYKEVREKWDDNLQRVKTKRRTNAWDNIYNTLVRDNLNEEDVKSLEQSIINTLDDPNFKKSNQTLFIRLMDTNPRIYETFDNYRNQIIQHRKESKK